MLWLFIMTSDAVPRSTCVLLRGESHARRDFVELLSGQPVPWINVLVGLFSGLTACIPNSMAGQ